MSALLTYLTKTKPDEVIPFYSEVLDFLIEFNGTDTIDEIEFLIESFGGHYPGDLLDNIDDILIPAIHQRVADFGIVIDVEQATKTDWFMLAQTIYSLETSPYIELIKDEVELTESDKEMLVNILINHGTMDEFHCYSLIKYVSALLRSRLVSKVESLEFKMPPITAKEPDIAKVSALRQMTKSTPPPTWTSELITSRQLLPGLPVRQLVQLQKQSLQEFLKMEPRLAANELVMGAILSDQPLADKFKVAKKIADIIYRGDLPKISSINEIIDQLIEV